MNQESSFIVPIGEAELHFCDRLIDFNIVEGSFQVLHLQKFFDQSSSFST